MIQASRKQFVRGVALAALLVFSGCSTFNRDWQAAGSKPASGMEGRWEGRWISAHNGHNGQLRALVQKLDNGQHEARFHAKYLGVLSFSSQVNLEVKPVADGVQFSGAADLGRPYGIYRYEGKASPTNFFSTYKATSDHGTFQMSRPK